jgi:branched-chain amino acid transport system ATP-binding protein
MNAILEVDHISKRFGGLQALQDLSFSVSQGMLLGIVGANGAGKTTLFRILSGALQPTSGHLRYQGEDVIGRSTSRLCAAGIACTFQIARPFPELTVLETVRLGALNRTSHVSLATSRAKVILDRVNLAHKADTAGRGLTVVERKRLDLARAYATQPKILLLDEVAAGLRPHEVEEFITLVRSLSAEGITILVIEHILPVIFALAQDVIVLDHGRRIAQGTPEEITRHRDVIEAYLGAGYAVA